jgi:hypothetical protein
LTAKAFLVTTLCGELYMVAARPYNISVGPFFRKPELS